MLFSFLHNLNGIINIYTHTHTHTHIYIYIYIYINNLFVQIGRKTSVIYSYTDSCRKDHNDTIIKDERRLL